VEISSRGIRILNNLRKYLKGRVIIIMSAGKKIPFRRCTGCGEMKPKKELVRILKTENGEITVDFTGRKNGRGAYLCPSLECFEKAVKTKGIEKSFKTPVPQEIYEELRKSFQLDS